jgi:23S rRNA pseudouridine1911/1915/1917 synthase
MQSGFEQWICYEDNHLLVVDKPAGLPTVGVKSGSPSLAKVAKAYLKRRYAKPGNVYLGAVSRLDAPVSGLVVLAKTSKSASRLSQQIRERRMQKRYWALVAGELKQASGIWIDDLRKDEASRTVRVVRRGGKRAELAFRVLAFSAGLTLVQIDLQTGRKHQIRVQFSSRGWPIVGDRKYGSRFPFGNGIALHSVALGLDHPTRRTRLSFSRRPPESWNLDRFSVDVATGQFDLE